MDVRRWSSRVRRHGRLIVGTAAAAVLLTGGGTLAATGRQPAVRPAASTPGIGLSEAEAFVALSPTRVLDTRQSGNTPFGPGETRTLTFGTWVPAEATSVALSIVSAAGATEPGYFTMWPSGQPRPETSVVNPVPAYDLATSALLRLGAGQGIDVFNAVGEADLIVDLLGYFVPMSEVDGAGGGSDFLLGAGPPAADLGEVGDTYYDTTNNVFYGPKTDEGWGAGDPVTGPAGPQGPQGVQGPAGPAGPAGAQGSTGPEGPAGPAGPAGADGATILSGAGAPAAGVGADGDFYVDTDTGTLYGPKAGGAWPPTGTSLQGPAGPAGPQGPVGTMGPGTQLYGTGVGLLSVLGAPEPVEFDEPPRTYGGGVGPYDEATGQLTIASAGTYRISYTASSTAAVAATVRVEVNGIPLPGSSSGGLVAVSSFNGEMLLTAAAGDVVELTFSALLGLNLTVDASMLVERVG